MGRTLVFLARMLEGSNLSQAKAIAIDERTAALTERNGHVDVEGEGSVYLVRARRPSEVCRPGTPLAFRNVDIYRVPKGGTSELKTWTGTKGMAYTLDVESGVIRSSQRGCSIY